MTKGYTLLATSRLFDMTPSHLNYYLHRIAGLKPAMYGKRRVYSVDDVRLIATWLAQHFAGDNPRKTLAEKVLCEIDKLTASGLPYKPEG